MTDETTDPVIPRAAIVATTEARYAHRDASGPYGAVKCRCGERFRTGVEQLQHASQSILQAAIPHLRGPLATAPGIPDSLVDMGVAGIGTMETQIPSLSTFQAQAVVRAVLAAAIPHLRPLVEVPVCNCYPGGFSPDSYEGPQHHCAVHGHGNDLPTSECPVCLGERSLIATATNLGRQLGRQEALEELPTPERLAREIHRLQFPTHAYCEPDSVDIRKAARALQALRDTGKGDSV